MSTPEAEVAAIRPYSQPADGDPAIGLSFGWWVDKHNRHHAHPNQDGVAPDHLFSRSTRHRGVQQSPRQAYSWSRIDIRALTRQSAFAHYVLTARTRGSDHIYGALVEAPSVPAHLGVPPGKALIT